MSEAIQEQGGVREPGAAKPKSSMAAPRSDRTYVELRCRSAFSFLDGASSPEDLIARGAALDYPILALGDRDGVYGAPRFHQAAKRAGMRPLVGCDLTLKGDDEGWGLRVGQKTSPQPPVIVSLGCHAGGS